MNAGQRYLWVDYAKGICILAVVCLYVNSNAIYHYQSSGFMQYFVDFAKPFRMPDFFLISGLFLARSINKPWRVYFDKKIFHYLYFFGLWTFISWMLMIATGELNESPIDSVKSLISMLILWPHHQLWFILMLPLYFFAVRITRFVPVWLMFPLLCLLQMFPPYHFSIGTLNDFGERFVYFYAGYAFAPFFFTYAEKIKKFGYWILPGLVVWGSLNAYLVFNGYAQHLPVVLVLGFFGAMAIIALAVIFERAQYFNWLRYIGEHSIAIYLPFNWILIGLAYSTLSIFSVDTLYLFMTLMILGCIAGSLALYLIAKKILFFSFLFFRPKWMKLS